MRNQVRVIVRFTTVLLVISCVVLPSAYGHIEQGQAAGFLTGLAHPWSGFDHILAMIAVGIWGAQLGNPALWILPVTFPMMMSLGAFMGLVGIPVPGVEIGIALSAIVLGVMVMGQIRPNLVIAMLVVGVFAIFHGHAHGTELPPGQNGLLYSMGFVVATGILHGVGILIGTLHRYHFGRFFLQGSGAFISFMGIVFLWQALS